MNLLFQIGSDYGTIEKISFILGGIALFLFGIRLMSNNLRSLAGEKLKSIIEKSTNTTIKGILTGIVITVLLQSSSGTTGIVVALISAGLMNLTQGITVIMGANIGTTITSIIIGLDISDYSLYIIAIGALICFFAKKQKLTYIGSVILGFGLIFFGLSLMGDTLITLMKEPFFENTLHTLSDRPLLGLLIGAGLTVLIQSSAGTIGITQKLYAEPNSSFALAGALPILLGSNLGTTFSGILSSLRGNKNAKRAALSHVIFNFVGCIIFMIILKPYTMLIQWIEDTFIGNVSGITISIAHVIFNIVTTVLLSFFIKQLVWIVNKIIKPDDSELLLNSVDQLNNQLLETPSLALKASKSVLTNMWNIVMKMWSDIKLYTFEYSKGVPEDIENFENLTDIYDNKLHDYLTKLSKFNLSDSLSKTQTLYFDTTRDLERIADHFMNLCEFSTDRYDYKITYYEETKNNVEKMLNLVETMISHTYKAFIENDKKSAKIVLETEPLVDDTEKLCVKNENELLLKNENKYSELHYIDFLSNLERIADHLNNIAENVINNAVHDVQPK